MRAPCHQDKITVNVDDYHNENDHDHSTNNNNGWWRYQWDSKVKSHVCSFVEFSRRTMILLPALYISLYRPFFHAHQLERSRTRVRNCHRSRRRCTFVVFILSWCSSNKMGNNETIKIQLNGRATAMGRFFPTWPLHYCRILLPFFSVAAAAFCTCWWWRWRWRSCPVYCGHSFSMFAVYVFSACTKWSVDDMMVSYFICELRIAHGFARVLHSYTIFGWIGVIWFDKNTTAA